MLQLKSAIWKPLTTNFVKVNTDAALVTESYTVGLGAICRYDKGTILGGTSDWVKAPHVEVAKKRLSGLVYPNKIFTS